jgi:hypothetical protein
LHRCTNLVTLDIKMHDAACNTTMFAGFMGQGTNHQTEALSMKHQLAAFQLHPATFLDPASWPLHACLTSFTHRLVDDNPYAAHLQNALRTPSLRHLSLLRNTLPPSIASEIATLTQLTHLAFSSETPNPTDPLVSSLASLSLLRHLHINKLSSGTLADLEPTQVIIPPSCRHLTLLTALHVSGGTIAVVRLPQLCILPSLEDMRVDVIAEGSLADLRPLSHLSKLTFKHTIVVPEGARDPEEDGPPGLHELALRGPWPPLATMLPRMTSLRVLALENFTVTPNLCRWVPQPSTPRMIACLAACVHPPCASECFIAPSEFRFRYVLHECRATSEGSCPSVGYRPPASAHVPQGGINCTSMSCSRHRHPHSTPPQYRTKILSCLSVMPNHRHEHS